MSETQIRHTGRCSRESISSLECSLTCFPYLHSHNRGSGQTATVRFTTTMCTLGKHAFWYGNWFSLIYMRNARGISAGAHYSERQLLHTSRQAVAAARVGTYSSTEWTDCAIIKAPESSIDLVRLSIHILQATDLASW